jgi:hypothetical protein
MAVETWLPGDPRAPDEGETKDLPFEFVNASGLPLNGSTVTALVATLKSGETEAVINSRNALTVLNANGGTTVGSSGLWDFVLGPLDTALVTGEVALGKRHLKRRLTLVGTYTQSAQVRTFVFELQFFMRSLMDVS